MSKIIFAISILAAIIIVLAPLSSVVGTHNVHPESTIGSPLFAVRTQRSQNEENAKNIITNYLGKGEQLRISLPNRSMTQIWIDRAIKIVDSEPILFNKLIEKLDNAPFIERMLNEYDISPQGFKNFIKMIQDNPSLVTEEIRNIQVPLDTIPHPLGLNTTIIECIVTGIVFSIVAVVITLIALFFTLRILTCLNVNNCADDIAQGIFDQLIQGLKES
jgi:hypothetical protein